MSEKRLILRASVKLLSAFALMWLATVFFAGIFDFSDDHSNEKLEINLTELQKGKAHYFTFSNRELLLIKTQDTTVAYWANDPIYGCRLEYNDTTIKPVCINIEYQLNGQSTDKQHQLTSPNYKIHNATLSLY